jgi:carboxymethylenebutenolidase
MGWSILGGETVEFRSGGATVRGHLGRPAAPGRYPAIVMIHGINGLLAGNKRAAERLGEAGYVALAIDWKSVEPEPHDQTILQYVEDAVAYLRGRDEVDGERIAVGGYCRGGALTYVALARYAWARAGVAFHATLKEQVDANRLDAFAEPERIQAPIVALHGAADPVSPVALTYRMAERLEALGKQFELKVYSGAGHGFALPDGSAYHPAAASDCWDEAIRFLDRYLRAEQPAREPAGSAAH